MHRRQLLVLGGASALLIGLAGLGAAWMRPPRVHGRLTPEARTLIAAVAGAVLDGLLPAEPTARHTALAAHLQRFEATVGGLAPQTQAEVDQLMALLLSPPGRLALFGLSQPWAEADATSVGPALQALRSSSLVMRQQVFHALRDLTNAAYFAERGVWQAIGYPGPRPL